MALRCRRRAPLLFRHGKTSTRRQAVAGPPTAGATLGRASGRVGALGGVAEVLQEQQAGHAHQRQGRAALVVTGELDRAGCGKVLGPGESHRGGTA